MNVNLLQRLLTVLHPEIVFLQGLGTISLKGYHQGRWCPCLPVSVGGKEPNYTWHLTLSCKTTSSHTDMRVTKNLSGFLKLISLFKSSKVIPMWNPTKNPWHMAARSVLPHYSLFSAYKFLAPGKPLFFLNALSPMELFVYLLQYNIHTFITRLITLNYNYLFTYLIAKSQWSLLNLSLTLSLLSVPHTSLLSFLNQVTTEASY